MRDTHFALFGLFLISACVSRESLRGPRRLRCRAALTAVGVAGLAAVTLPLSHAQEMEPRSYSNAPVGLNFVIAGYAYTQGGVAFDTSLPLANPDLGTSSAVLAYGRVLDFWGKSAKLNVIVPYSAGAEPRIL